MRTKDHVDLNGDQSDDDVTYNSVPPTSGDHWSTPVRCGFYNQPVPDELIVHNMEHSNVIVSYNLPDPSDLDALVAIYADLQASGATISRWFAPTRIYRKAASLSLPGVSSTLWTGSTVNG